MKIIQLIQKPQKRGVEIFTTQLSKHLIENGHDVLLVSVYSKIEDVEFNQKIQTLNGKIKNRFFDIHAWFKLNQIISEFKPDVIQCNSSDTLKYAVFSKLLFRWKTPLVFRNASTMSLYLKNPIHKSVNAFLLGFMTNIISVSHVSANDLKKTFPKNIDMIRVIPIGIEEYEIKEIQWIQSSDKLLHIIHVGGFSFEKNHKGLLRIFSSIIEKNPKVHLHLLGDGIFKNEIEEIVIQKGLSNEVSFYGNVANPLDYIAIADVLVLPSIIEGLPAVILEAMYVKTPVVAYNVGGIEELITHGKTGYLVTLNNENEFINTLLKVLEEKNRPTVENAYALVNENFTNRKITERFEAVYNNIIVNEKN